jgi:DNA-binding NarL/FixJ family response regulator
LEGTTGGIRVLILDESPITRNGLRAVLHQAGIEVVGAAADHSEALALLAQTDPHVMVVHSSKEDPTEAVTVVRQVCDRGGRGARGADREVKLLALVSAERFSACMDPLTMDADGTLLSSAAVEDLVAALRMLVAGYALFPAPSGRSAPPATRAGSTASVGGGQFDVRSLTPRERDVLRLLGRGCTNAEISERLSLSESTVKSHVQNVLAKLGLRNRVEAALRAVEAGLAP